MQIMGIAGRMECGKTTLMEYMASEFFVCVELNFGDLLKKEVANAYGFPLGLCYSEEGKNTIININPGVHPQPPKSIMRVRELLQWYGTDYIRADRPNHWVDLMGRVIGDLDTTKIRTIMIGDVRFPNEVAFIKSMGGRVIQLLPYCGWDKHSDHESETALDNCKDFWMTMAPPFGTLEETAKYILRIW